MIYAAALLTLAATQSTPCGPEHYASVDNMSEFIVLENSEELSRMYRRQPTGKAIVALEFNQVGKLIHMKVVCSTSQVFEKVALRYIKSMKFNIPSTAKRNYKMAMAVIDADASAK